MTETIGEVIERLRETAWGWEPPRTLHGWMLEFALPRCHDEDEFVEFELGPTVDLYFHSEVYGWRREGIRE